MRARYDSINEPKHLERLRVPSMIGICLLIIALTSGAMAAVLVQSIILQLDDVNFTDDGGGTPWRPFRRQCPWGDLQFGIRRIVDSNVIR